jgi:hypothetical protein
MYESNDTRSRKQRISRRLGIENGLSLACAPTGVNRSTIWRVSRNAISLAYTPGNRSETAGAPAIATRRPDRARPTPIWPLLLGLALIGVGIFLGYTVDVGPYCDGAFTSQTSAGGADIASAMNGTRQTTLTSGRFTVGQQSGVYGASSVSAEPYSSSAKCCEQYLAAGSRARHHGRRIGTARTAA